MEPTEKTYQISGGEHSKELLITTLRNVGYGVYKRKETGYYDVHINRRFIAEIRDETDENKDAEFSQSICNYIISVDLKSKEGRTLDKLLAEWNPEEKGDEK